MKTHNQPLAALRHHVSGAIARGEKQAIAGIPADAAHTEIAFGPRFHYWPEYTTGNWIVSETVSGTNNERAIAECPDEESAKQVCRACNSHKTVCALLERAAVSVPDELRREIQETLRQVRGA